MKIGVWSPIQRDETADLTALLSTIASITFPCKVVATENYIGVHNLGHLFLGERYNCLRLSFEQYRADRKKGDAFLKFLSEQTEKKLRKQRCLEIVPEALYFNPLNQSLQKEIYEYGFAEEYEYLLDFCSMYFDYSFWNIETNKNITTQRLIDDVDLVVVCLPANMEKLRSFCDTYQSILSKCVVVIFDRACMLEKGTITRRKLRTRYGIQKSHFIEVGKTRELGRMLREGKTVEYVCAHFKEEKGTKEYETVQRLKYLCFEVLRQENNLHPFEFEELNRFLFRKNFVVPGGNTGGSYNTPPVVSYVAERK